MSDKLHAVYDYLLSAFVVLSPWIFGFYSSPTAMRVTVIFGGISFLNALLSGHKASLLHKAPLYYHLAIDCCRGLFFALSPWIFGFSNVVFLPQLIIGFVEMTMAILTHIPEEEQSDFTF